MQCTLDTLNVTSYIFTKYQVMGFPDIDLEHGNSADDDFYKSNK